MLAAACPSRHPAPHREEDRHRPVSEFQTAYPLILNKVASPQFVTPTLRRPRLLDWLHASANCRATVIAADAGYGKTTLLWQWEREVDFPCYWYKLDRNDRDWTLHVSYIAQAIALRHHGFGRRTHSMLQQVTGPGVSRPGVAAYLLAEMHDRLTEPCTFIIDDWQFVNAVTEVRGLWNQILRDAPPTCRFVFASRAKPRLQFARFKTHGGYAAIGTDALRFTPDEVESLFREIYNSPLEAAELQKLEARTEGWAASLHLVSVSLRDRTDEQRKAFIESLSATTDSDLFEFLAEEVVDQESPDTRDLLLTTSILQQITPELAERLAGVQDGVRELMALEHRGLFTYRLDEGRYRYHNLFRDYLERRLAQERSEAEVSGLHIHAASYFETSQQWPEAIHHYLRAGLQRQAARLLARHGEQLVAEGRLDLIGEWLGQLPQRMIRENARLNLLLGELAGFQADWTTALEALEGARAFFAKKGDQRMQALACVKLSSIHHYRGDAELAAATAREGLELVPDNDVATRLRLEGNVAITHGLTHDHLESVAAVCRRISTEAASHGYEHFAVIGLHNAGDLDLSMARIPEAVDKLTRASRFWDSLPPNPSDDRHSLTVALLAADRVDEAERVSLRSVDRSRHWRRSHKLSLITRAELQIYRGRFREAAELLLSLVSEPEALGFVNVAVGWSLIKALYLGGASTETIDAAMRRIEAGPQDERHGSAALIRAVALHSRLDCGGACIAALDRIRELDARGYRFLATEGLMVTASFAIDHRRPGAVRLFREALERATATRLLRYCRWWSRRCTAAARQLGKQIDGPRYLIELLNADPDGWRIPIASIVSDIKPEARGGVLSALRNYPSRDLADALRDVRGTDASTLRRDVLQSIAPRLYIRTFGELAVHRGSWVGPKLTIHKKRLRQLLSLLVAYSERKLTRDAAADALWPEADAISAGNSLNQAAFQLRRMLDASYRDGDSPSYILTSSDYIELNPQLVQTDLALVRHLASRDGTTVPRTESTLDLIRGGFLPDLKFEDWGAAIQASVHAEIRESLLPIAEQQRPSTEATIAVRAACALVDMDPFDERAQIAMANALAADGRRVAARESLARFAERFRREMDEEPSAALLSALRSLEARSMSTKV
jgi:ATP/maltotriose-dependent transcriptional regulator MalT/DNA-binding SARP family transcriptional activator